MNTRFGSSFNTVTDWDTTHFKCSEYTCLFVCPTTFLIVSSIYHSLISFKQCCEIFMRMGLHIVIAGKDFTWMMLPDETVED